MNSPSTRIPVVREREKIPVDRGELPVTWFHAGATAGPSLVIVPSIYGVHPDLERQMVWIARATGGLVAAIDSFWNVDRGPVPYSDPQRAIERMGKLDKEAAMADFAQAIAWIREHEGCDGRLAGLGVCFGGPFVFLAASQGLLDGVVTWHGSRLDQFLNLAPAIKVPMALHFGAHDTAVPMDTVEEVRAAFAEHDGVDVVVHPGAGHGFSHPDGPAFREPAALASMQAAVDLVRSLPSTD